MGYHGRYKQKYKRRGTAKRKRLTASSGGGPRVCRDCGGIITPTFTPGPFPEQTWPESCPHCGSAAPDEQERETNPMRYEGTWDNERSPTQVERGTGNLYHRGKLVTRLRPGGVQEYQGEPSTWSPPASIDLLESNDSHEFQRSIADIRDAWLRDEDRGAPFDDVAFAEMKEREDEADREAEERAWRRGEENPMKKKLTKAQMKVLKAIAEGRSPYDVSRTGWTVMERMRSMGILPDVHPSELPAQEAAKRFLAGEATMHPLYGLRIVSVRGSTKEEQKENYWGPWEYTVVDLDDGSKLFSLEDPEGNGPGEIIAVPNRRGPWYFLREQKAPSYVGAKIVGVRNHGRVGLPVSIKPDVGTKATILDLDTDVKLVPVDHEGYEATILVHQLANGKQYYVYLR